MSNPNLYSSVTFVVFGVVQGVGFRPFIYRLAQQFHYNGWVKNIGFGVEIHLETPKKTDFKEFLQALKEKKPPLAQIESITFEQTAAYHLQNFRIEKSSSGKSFVFISPDISICQDCLQEMKNPLDRRYRYPFINCTNCGPRYTIVKSLPYDREQTTMAKFKMCADCRKEYSDPLDRRYHAQPIACPICGPQLKLIEAKTEREIEGGVEKAALFIKRGKILAVKGLGGFHLVCSTFNSQAVDRLRRIKRRKTKPLALMAKNLEVVKKYAYLSYEEKEQLASVRRPIVLLRKKRDIEGIAPHLDELGFMLPYTPLHYLLLEELELIVATSSNQKDAPLMKEEEEGIEKLCDYILTHDRAIKMRADDSVLKVVNKQPLFFRRARGYVPYPQKVPSSLVIPNHILALGAELKDTVSIYKNGYVITSQFLGDLDEYLNYKYFQETVDHLAHLFEVKPEIVVSDLHPDFRTTRFAQKTGLIHFQVQHHFAHVLAPLLEHNILPEKKVLGVALDGYGYGDDGQAWGGEFLLADYISYQRLAHFKYVPLPGGDLASKQPWRMALSYLIDTFGPHFPQPKVFQAVKKNMLRSVELMITNNLNCPLSSSCGRLFDAVSFLTGISPLEVEFEAEAPMRLESAAEEGIDQRYKFSIDPSSFPLQISFRPMIKSILRDLELNVPLSQISSKFHNTLAQVIVSIAEYAKKNFDIETVVLIGGVFLNKILLKRTTNILEKKRFQVIRPINYSPNDESISLGQIAYALNRLKIKKK